MIAKRQAKLVSAVNQVQAEIAQWRSRVSQWHPAPPPLETAGYLVTEAAEALDAVLRRQRPSDDRTNSHDSKDGLDKEIAQVLDMALTLANLYEINVGQALAEWLQEVETRCPDELG